MAEARLMTRFDHSNIVGLIGYCTIGEPLCVLMELMMYGDLKGYLLAHRHLCGTNDPVSTHLLCENNQNVFSLWGQA